MLRKFNLMCSNSLGSNSLDGLRRIPPIQLLLQSLDGIRTPQLTLSLAQLNNCYVQLLPLPRMTTDTEKFQDIYRKSKLSIFGQTRFPEKHADKIHNIDALFKCAAAASLINRLFLDFINLGLFAQSIWLYAAKTTLEQPLVNRNENYFCGHADDYESSLSIVNITPHAVEVDYSDKIRVLDSTHSGFPAEIFAGVFNQRVSFSVSEAPPSDEQNRMNDIITPGNYSYLKTQVLEASYYQNSLDYHQPNPGDFGFAEIPILMSDRPVVEQLLTPPTSPLNFGTPKNSPSPTCYSASPGSLYSARSFFSPMDPLDD